MHRLIRHIPAVIMLASFWCMGISASIGDSVTIDELLHITAGYSCWRTGEYRLQPENGLLPQLVAGIPLALSDFQFDFQNQRGDLWNKSDVMHIGSRMFYAAGNDPRTMLIHARMVCGLIGVALGATIYAWSLGLFGLIGAYVSLTAFILCPITLAHGVYATSDSSTALMFLWTTAALKRLCKTPSWSRAIIAGLAMAGLALTKYSVPIIVPVLIGLLIVYRPGWRISAHLGIVALLAWAMIWTAYRWRYQAIPPGDSFYPGWEWVYGRKTLPLAVVSHLQQWRLLPEAWLYGLAHSLSRTYRPSYLMGEVSMGHWYYFPVAILIKTPLAILAAAPLALIKLDRRAWPLILLIGVYLAIAMAAGPYIGIRHLLPAYAACFILFGNLAIWLNRGGGGDASACSAGGTPGGIRFRQARLFGALQSIRLKSQSSSMAGGFQS